MYAIRSYYDRLLERLGANSRGQARDAGRAALDLDDGLAVEERERQHVARINQVGVGHLRIDLPNFRPVPGVLQEHARDVPERVAGNDDVAVWMARVDEHG